MKLPKSHSLQGKRSRKTHDHSVGQERKDHIRRKDQDCRDVPDDGGDAHAINNADTCNRRPYFDDSKWT